MGLAMEAQPARAEQPDGAKHIVFFKVETNVPGHLCRSYELLEFGAVVLDAVRGLGELRSFHTLIRPKDISCIDRCTTECNTITSAIVADAPTFADVADEIYHGHVWAGHNILGFDIPRVKEAFLKIGRLAPQPSGVVDTYHLLRRRFGKQAGNLKLATLASYCGYYGKEEHRSIAHVHMNIHVLQNCATKLFLESNYPDIFMAQVDLATSTSMLEQSPSFFTSSPQNRFLGNGDEEQEVAPQIRSVNRARDKSSASRTSGQSRRRVRFKMDKDSEIVANPLRRTNLLSAFEAVDDMGKEEQPHSSCSKALMEDEEFVSSKLLGVSSVLEVDHIQEDVRTGYESAIENASAAKMMDLKSEEELKALMHFLEADEAQLRDALLCMVDKPVKEQDLLQVSNDSRGDMEAAGAIRSPKFVEEQDLLQVSNESTRDMEAAAGTIISPINGGTA